MRPWWLLGVLASALACANAGPQTAGGPSAPVEPVASPSGPRPSWLDGQTTLDTSADPARLYAVGSLEIPIGELAAGCWDAGHAVKTAENRALAELAKAERGHPLGETALTGAMPLSAWFDGAGKLYVLAVHAQSNPLTPTDPPAGGSSLQAVASHLRSENRRLLEQSGACRDPAKRPTLPCCGRPDELCEDVTRFDNRPRPDRCRCGTQNPCTYDFACEGGRCVCKGSACPCDVLKCKVGQTCGDGRCY
ncbi:MAG: hypothetical protein U1E65_08510 [Myxococcota bacterium]